MNESINNKGNKLIKKLIPLFSSTIITSILGLFNTSILVLSLGMENNGIIYLVQSYTTIFNSLFNFQSFEAIIKYLPYNMDNGNEKGKNYIKIAIWLDILTAILAFIVSFLLVDTISNYLGWSTDIIIYIKISCFSILFNLTGAFTGILRIYEKFNFISIINVIRAVSTSIIYIIGYLLNLNILYYILMNVVIYIITLIITLILTYITLRENNMNKLHTLSVNWDKEFIKFAIYTNISSTLDIPVFQLAPIIINQYVGLSEIAVYKVLEKIGSVVSSAVSIFTQVLIPEISKKIANNKVNEAIKISNKIKKSVIILGVFILLFTCITYEYWLGYFILNYNEHMYSVYLYIIFVIITTSFVGQHPIFIYLGFAKYNIYILAIVNTLYLIGLICLAKYLGINGVILTRIIQALMIFSVKGFIMNKYLKSNKLVPA